MRVSDVSSKTRERVCVCVYVCICVYVYVCMCVNECVIEREGDCIRERGIVIVYIELST
jgi:hypothetical protein